MTNLVDGCRSCMPNWKNSAKMYGYYAMQTGYCPKDDNLLDNQDLCLLFKVSIKTLQRYRAIGALPYFTISGKVYYKASDVREFIKERFSITTLRQFEKEHCTKKKK